MGIRHRLSRLCPVGKKLNKRQYKSKPDMVELGKIHCLTSGFLSSEKLFSANASSQVLMVAPEPR
jgi:hypothetical protein